MIITIPLCTLAIVLSLAGIFAVLERIATALEKLSHD